MNKDTGTFICVVKGLKDLFTDSDAIFNHEAP